MASEADRQAVLKVTKIRKYLKQDGSWIHTSQVDTQLQQTRKSLVPVNLSSAESSPVSSPITSTTQSPASASPSSTPQRTYIQSALRKFEAFSSTENTPVRSKVKSPHTQLEESGSANVKGAVSEPTEIPVEEALKTSKVTPEEKENEIPADTPTEEALKTSKVTPEEKENETPADTPTEEALKTSKVTPEEKENETPADMPTEQALESSKVTPVEEAFEIPADTPLEEESKAFEAFSDTPLEEVLETEVTPVEEAAEIPADIPVEQELETSKVTNVEEAFEIPADTPLEEESKAFEAFSDTPLEEVLETEVTPVEEAAEIPADIPVEQELETSKVTNVVKAAEIPPDNPAEATVETFTITSVHESLETSKVTNVVKAAEIPPDNPAEATVETFIITSVHESLKTSLDTPPKVLLDTSRGALKEETVNALDNNPAEPPGQLTTDNWINSTDDLVTTEIVHKVETTPEPRHAEYEPTEATNEYGEFSLQSALETPYTQPSVSTNESSLRPRLIVNVKMCSLCKQPINGNVKITVEDPAICCHPECFKCDGCSKPLGDFLSSMYHHAGRVLCERCFDDVFFTP